MKALLISILTLSQAMLATAADKEAGVHAHEGVWKPIAAVFGGVRLAKADLDAITMTIKGIDYEVFVSGENRTDKGTYTLDETTTPKRITLKGVSGPNEGKTIRGIYEMKDANSLRVCYDMSGGDFPKEFKATKGTQLYLAGYRRQKNPPPATGSK